MIYVLQKKEPRSTYEIKYSLLTNDDISKDDLIKFLIFNNFDKFSRKFNFKFAPSAVRGTTFTFNDNTTVNVLESIKKNSNLYLTEKEVAQGIVFPQDFVNKKTKETLKNLVEIGDGIFVLSKAELKSLNLTTDERKLIKPYFTTKELEGYYANPKNKFWIIYTGSEFKNPKSMLPYPSLKKHLDKFKDVITSDNKPYGLHRTRVEAFFKGEKIIVQRKCPNRPSFTYTNFNCYVSATFYIIKTKRLNQKYLVGLLNSKMIAFWLRHKGKMQGDNFQLDKAPLLSIPIFKPNESISKRLENIVNQILTLKSQGKDTTALEQQIDNMVYKLYELTYDEVKVIDPAFALTEREYENIKIE